MIKLFLSKQQGMVIQLGFNAKEIQEILAILFLVDI